MPSAPSASLEAHCHRLRPALSPASAYLYSYLLPLAFFTRRNSVRTQARYFAVGHACRLTQLTDRENPPRSSQQETKMDSRRRLPPAQLHVCTMRFLYVTSSLGSYVKVPSAGKSTASVKAVEGKGALDFQNSTVTNYIQNERRVQTLSSQASMKVKSST